MCAGSCGPGNTHLIQGLYDAHRSGAPVLAIASQISSDQIGTGYFQETHPERLFVECSWKEPTVTAERVWWPGCCGSDRGAAMMQGFDLLSDPLWGEQS